MQIRSMTVALYYVLLVFIIGCSSGCGGSSSRSDSTQKVIYAGEVNPATIDSNNAIAIFSSIWGGNSAAEVTPMIAKPVPGSSTYPNISVKIIRYFSNQLLRGLPAQTGKAFKAGQSAKSIAETLHGSISGTASYTGAINTDGTGTMYIVFSNYNNGDGNTIDGKFTYFVTGYDTANSIIINGNISVPRLTITTSSSSYSLSGTIIIASDIANISTNETYDICIRNESTSEVFKLEHYSVSRTFDSLNAPTKCNELIAGRFYLQNYGYVDISQESPFTYNYLNQLSESIPDSGGSLLISGSNGTKIKVTPVSILQFRMEVDTNGDDAYETNRIFQWAEFADAVSRFTKPVASFGGKSMGATTDGGSIIAGNSYTNGSDLVLAKTNVMGDLEWEKVFGGTRRQSARSVIETADKGFILTGYSFPGGSYPFGYGGEEIFVIKTDSNGNLLWEKTFSGLSQWAYSIKQTADGGFIIMGGITPSSGLPRLYLLRLNANGDMLWDKTFGTGYEICYSMTAADDGGYVMAGYTHANWYDAFYIVKTDASGNPVWERTFNKTYNARAYSILKNSSGNYVVSGYADNAGYLVGIGSTGDLLWSNTFDNFASIIYLAETPDGNLILSAPSQYSSDYYLVKTDAQGSQQWQKPIYVSGKSPTVFSVLAGMDGGYLLGANRMTSPDSLDLYLIKTDRDGNTR